jgi:hypothetical protein
MNAENNRLSIDEGIIVSKIHTIRGKQVMLSNDLAELYQVETKVLNQQVKRNINRFPERYMFQLSQNEYDTLRSQNVTLKRGQHSKYLPFAFTEHGILMLSSVLRSKRAEKVNMIIIDTFVRIRELMFLHKDMVFQLEQVKLKLIEHDNEILAVLEYLKELNKQKKEEIDFKDRTRIGYKK